MSDDTPVSPVRIALREEGGSINAYLAQTGTMKGAKLLGSLSVGMARVPGVFDAYREFWQTAMSALVEDAIPGVKVTGFVDLPVPEHEKGGRA